MGAFVRLLERLAYNLSGTIAFTGHVLVYDDCLHCDARTLCEVSALHRHSRCLECGRSTHGPDERLKAWRRGDERELVAA